MEFDGDVQADVEFPESRPGISGRRGEERKNLREELAVVGEEERGEEEEEEEGVGENERCSRGDEGSRCFSCRCFG